ncbi:putative secreted protein (Por secretion system target) [Flavobacterium sp. 270]|uniref:T9SS type A sorting domain-containing protein n=1 Tax=Flavobacterium sp. 270 TaxID=2512114 RepID=UPI001066A54C|nr:T9SS type A sorting domain-containing protein [Flavobacterium sp. 270]TDW48761.1 putative secreted protein (Por secretion system target) [Flavobacterium sp. 270]
MRKKLLLLVFLFTGMVNAQILTFTDPTFKAMLVNGGSANITAYSGGSPVTRIDTNFDNQISTAEAAVIDRLWIEGANANQVTNIQGIEGFTNLTDLGFREISVTSINLSGMPNLKTFFCKSPTLVTATLSGFTAATTITLQENPLLTTLNISNCPSLTTIVAQQNAVFSTLNVSNLVALKTAYFADNQLTALDFTGCPNLEYFNATNNKITSINVAGLSKLTDMSIEDNLTITSINAAGCTLLNFSPARFGQNHEVVTADFSNCSSLQRISFANNKLTSLNLLGCSALTNLDANDNNLNTLNVSGCTALLNAAIYNNKLTALNLSTSPNLVELRVNNNLISNLNLTGCVNLETVNLNSNQIPSINLSGNTHLKVLELEDNPTTSLNLSGCTALTTLNMQTATIANGDFSNCSALASINNTSGLLNSVNVQGCTALSTLSLSGLSGQIAPITTLNTSGLTNLKSVNIGYTSLTGINLTGCGALTNLFCLYSPITALNFSDSPNIENLNVTGTKLQSIDISNLKNFQSLSANDIPTLETLFAKNGKNETLFFTASKTALKFVCQDEVNITSTKNYLNSLGLSSTVVNSYCTFTPGGNYNTVTGTIAFDLNNNGCDASDPKQPNVKVGLNDGTVQSEAFTEANGKYTYYTGTGNFNIVPHLENPTLFSISPVNALLTFPDINNNVAVRDFCITANGSQSDVEIVIAPIAPAKPGFMAWYQIVIKNKGNQAVSGNLNFTYNENLLHYGIATLAPDVQNPGVLGWNYTNLLPFESKSYYVGLNVNTPTQIPPANLGDILNFSATVNPIAGDFYPTDNVFNYHETVVGSFDPNDITCLEGESVSPSAIGDYLHYVINFENTGTADAENIVVKVTIDATKYDVNSLQLIATSHPSKTIITGNVVQFIFPNINLSTSKEKPIGGHGNILLKVKTLPNLVTGDQVEKGAEIFFDYNAPIDTNTAETIFKALGIKDSQEDKSMALYPNPTKGNVNINCDSAIKTIELFDVQGRILQTVIEDSNSAQLDISNKSNGLYFIRITTDAGSKVEKLIKE